MPMYSLTKASPTAVEDTAGQPIDRNAPMPGYRLSRAARPPRRVVGFGDRPGRSSRTRARASGVNRDHCAISSMVRAHPVHNRVSGCTTHTFTHGLSISLRRHTPCDVPLDVSDIALFLYHREPVKRALQDQACGHMVYNLGATLTVHIRLEQRALGRNR